MADSFIDKNCAAQLYLAHFVSPTKEVESGFPFFLPLNLPLPWLLSVAGVLMVQAPMMKSKNLVS